MADDPTLPLEPEKKTVAPKPPKPARFKPDWAGAAQGAGLVVVVAGVVGVLIPAMTRPTLGATRSSRLKWQQRQQQLQQDIAAAEKIERERGNG